MGNMHAQEAADLVAEGMIGLRTAISMNLSSNHFPAIPGEYVDPIVKAIEEYPLDPEAVIDIEAVRNTGMVPRLAFEEDGVLKIKAADLLEITHSWHFVEQDDDWAEDEDDEA